MDELIVTTIVAIACFALLAYLLDNDGDPPGYA